MELKSAVNKYQEVHPHSIWTIGFKIISFSSSASLSELLSVQYVHLWHTHSLLCFVSERKIHFEQDWNLPDLNHKQIWEVGH